MNSRYDELASRTLRGELVVKLETVRRGDSAGHAEIQRLVMEATGADTVEEAVAIAGGGETP